jgi:signal transduction histidine kinase/DNA-binding response OmpR family regulator
MLIHHQLSSNPNIAQSLEEPSKGNNPAHPPQKLELAKASPVNSGNSNLSILNAGDRQSAAINLGLNNSATILIVDDTPNNLQVLFSSLETAGFTVLLAEDSASALQIAQAQNPDLILLDVLMPDVDGFATCSQLKAQAATKEIPVIFLTALADRVNKAQGFKLGGVDFITKPIEQAEVLVRIQTHLNLRNMSRALARQNKELQQALEFKALVRRITDQMRDSSAETDCLRIATEEVATVLHLSGCQIELYDPQQQTATIVHEFSITLPRCQGETRQINDFPELDQQLWQKKPLQLGSTLPPFNPQGIQVNRLACPIFDDRGMMGNLWGLRPPGEIFTTLEINVMEQVADQCAIAIRQAQLYASSNQQVAELAKLNQLKDDFLKTISHELKAPISSIQLAAQTLESLLNAKQNPRQSPMLPRVLKIFRESCQQQKKLTDDLLTLCYIDAQATVIQPESIELNSLLTNLVKPYLSAQNQHQQTKIFVKLSRQKPKIYADPVILRRIVQELLNNALQHTPLEGKITLQTRIVKPGVLIQVIDTGRKIPEAEQPQLFNQFYRGTGLGLSLAQRLVDVLKATIEVSSDRQGTVFTVTLPLESN